MAENIAQTIQKAIQDLVAPDVRELKVLVENLQKQMDQRFETQQKHTDDRFDAQQKHTDGRFDAQRATSDAQFTALMAALGEFKAQSELANMRVIAALSERVAVLEANRHQ